MRTQRKRPSRAVKRVVLGEVLKDCRLTFFSSAPRMRVHGSMMVVLVGTKDIRFLQLTWDACEDCRRREKRSNSAPPSTGRRGGCRPRPTTYLLCPLYRN